MDLLFDPLFHLPFVVGLALAPLVAVVGAYLRLREEWLAALAYTQIAAAGGMLAVVLHGPVLVGSLAAAMLAAMAKGLSNRGGNDHFALAYILAWGATLLLAGFSHHGSHAGSTLFDGQLYFIGYPHLIAASLLLALVVIALPLLHRAVLLMRLFPDHYAANRRPAWPYGMGFDLVTVAALAIATTVFGVVAAFALVFVPSWIAWHLAVGWRQVLVIAAGVALFAYVGAFALAIIFDQPPGPVLALILGLLATLRWWPRRVKR